MNQVYSLPKALRQIYDVPILLLTAHDQIDDKLLGFHSGANDYLTKPFEPAELLARIRVMLKYKKDPIKLESIHFKDYHFLLKQGNFICKTNQYTLTSSELILLKTLAQNPRQPFSRQDLCSKNGP